MGLLAKAIAGSLQRKLTDCFGCGYAALCRDLYLVSPFPAF